MEKQPDTVYTLARTGHTVTVVVIILAYAVTIADYFARLNSPSGPSYSVGALLIAIALGVVYLLLLISGPPALESVLGRYATVGFFVLAIILMLVIQFLLMGNGAIWLISMPLVALAVTDLPARWRWPVYAAAIGGLALPVYIASGSWSAALIAALTFGAAVVFVVVFVHLTIQAEAAQQRSETLAEELEQVNQQLAAYAVQAEELATIQERNRLAREIHDNLGHYLTVINVQIQAAQALIGKDPDRAAQALVKAQQLTQDGLSAVRQSVSALRESPLGGRSLDDALGSLMRETRASGLLCEATIRGDARPLDPRVELTLYRSAQEALTNVRKHARASRVDLTLDYIDPDVVTLTVTDNGIGTAEVEGMDRFGLLGMRERVHQLGGTLTINTAPGQGFELALSLPSATLGLVVADAVNGPTSKGSS